MIVGALESRWGWDAPVGARFSNPSLLALPVTVAFVMPIRFGDRGDGKPRSPVSGKSFYTIIAPFRTLMNGPLIAIAGA
jgi:hypothetical protein